MQQNSHTDVYRHQALEIVRVSPAIQPQLAEFFRYLSNDPEAHFFHPHDFSDEAAQQIAHFTGQDMYFAMLYNNQVLGYGMLRGWDEGYAIPSLGIAIHPAARNKGLGKLFMDFLHAAARLRGAEKTRLRVYPDNLSAIRLYSQLGYQFLPENENDQLVAYFNLVYKSNPTGEPE